VIFTLGQINPRALATPEEAGMTFSAAWVPKASICGGLVQPFTGACECDRTHLNFLCQLLCSSPYVF
jgi:hypothetical protein